MLDVRRGLTARCGLLYKAFSGLIVVPADLKDCWQSRLDRAPDAQTRYWASGDNTRDLPAKSLTERSLVRALIRPGDLSPGNYGTKMPAFAISNILIINNKPVVPVAGIEPATFGLQNRCSTI